MLLTFIFAISLSTAKQDAVETKKESINKDLREILLNKAFMFLLFCVFLVYAGSSTIYYFYSIFLKEHGASSSLIGFAISFQGLCELPFLFFCTHHPKVRIKNNAGDNCVRNRHEDVPL